MAVLLGHAPRRLGLESRNVIRGKKVSKHKELFQRLEQRHQTAQVSRPPKKIYVKSRHKLPSRSPVNSWTSDRVKRLTSRLDCEAKKPVARHNQLPVASRSSNGSNTSKTSSRLANAAGPIATWSFEWICHDLGICATAATEHSCPSSLRPRSDLRHAGNEERLRVDL